MEGAFGDVVPRADERLELRERRVDFLRHRRLLGLLSNHFDRELLEIAQHGGGELKELDLALELRLHPLEGDRVFLVIVGQAVDLYGGDSMIEGPPKIDGERVVRLLVEAELAHRA